MKKWMNIVLLSASLLGVMAGGNVLVAAEDDKSATTAGSVEFIGGSMSLSGATDKANFGDKVSLATVLTEGFKGRAALAATVTDYRGSDTPWQLSLSMGNWSGNSKTGEATLNAVSVLKVADDDITTAKSAIVAKQAGAAEDHTLVTETKFEKEAFLVIPAGSNVKAGAYTNTLTWSLSDGVADTQD